MAHLVVPSEKYRDSFLQAYQEFASGCGFVASRELEKPEWSLGRLQIDFGSYIQHIYRMKDRTTQRPDLVPETRLWLIEDDEFVGVISIRHELNDFLRIYGGNIGYAIRPSRQKQGYDTTMLRLALEYVKQLGIDKVLITCDWDNIGSRKVIESNGGILENEIEIKRGDEIVLIRRYWIDLSD